MANKLHVDKIIETLNLVPLPLEGGFFRQTWLQEGTGSCIYFLLTDSFKGFSALHTLTASEIYHFYGGDTVDLCLFPPLGEKVLPLKITLGNDLLADEFPQYWVPPHWHQGSCLQVGGSWALLGTTIAPAYMQEMFALSSRKELIERFPDWRDDIVSLTREEP